MTDTVLALVLLGAAAGGFAQGLSGFAFGLVAMAFWAWVIPPQLAGPLVAGGSLLGQLSALHTVRRSLAPCLVAPFILGGLLGVPIGAVLLPHIDQTTFKIAVGVLLTLWSAGMLLARELPRIRCGGRVADATAGLIGGVMGGIGGLNGPAPVLWCTLRGWDPDVQRAAFQSFSLVMQTVTIATYVALGLIRTETLQAFALVAPALLIPTLLGARLYRRFSPQSFRRLILGLLLFSGIILVTGSLTHLLSR